MINKKIPAKCNFWKNKIAGRVSQVYLLCFPIFNIAVNVIYGLMGINVIRANIININTFINMYFLAKCS